MRALFPAACLAILVGGAAVAAPTPEQVWKSSIADQNTHYARVPHAMLKIQDSVYLRDGDGAVLQGCKGRPGSWHWNQDAKAHGPLAVSLKDGKLAVLQDGKPLDAGRIAKSIAVDKDIDIAGQPTQVGAGVQGWRLFLYNQQNPTAKNFTGVSYFPYDPAFRVMARFVPDPKLPAHVFRTSRGTDKQFYHAGDARFTLRGRQVTLPFYAGSQDSKEIADISAFFTDQLTGNGAYSAGRYVDVADFGKFPPAAVVIDFNLAYNPNCARSAHFTCPLAIDDIALAVKAGERDPHIKHR
jgi:uncharacterized protein (DUF1684 family)